MAGDQTVEPQNLPARALYYGLQPAILLAVIGVWLTQPTNPTLFVGCVLAIQLVLGVLEHLYPARGEWRLSGKQRSSSIVLVLILFFVAGAVGDFYTQVLDPFLSGVRDVRCAYLAPSLAAAGPNVHRFFSQRTAVVLGIVLNINGLWFGVSPVMGRITLFKKLGALNFGLNQFWSIFSCFCLPALLELIFGIGAPALGASLLLVSQASIAHCNVAMNSRVIGWLFTTNQYHICHHSLI